MSLSFTGVGTSPLRMRDVIPIRQLSLRTSPPPHGDSALRSSCMGHTGWKRVTMLPKSAERAPSASTLQCQKSAFQVCCALGMGAVRRRVLRIGSSWTHRGSVWRASHGGLLDSDWASTSTGMMQSTVSLDFQHCKMQLVTQGCPLATYPAAAILAPLSHPYPHLRAVSTHRFGLEIHSRQGGRVVKVRGLHDPLSSHHLTNPM
jgi:hypothetical protein